MWQEALRHTQIVRARISYLSSFSATQLPYIFLADSHVNPGDTVVRQGKILVDKPAIILPEHLPQFDGFDFEEELKVNRDNVVTFFLIRGVSFPSLKFKNEVSSLDVFENSLKKAEEHFKQNLERREDVQTGLITGPEDCWQFSLLVYVSLLMGRSNPSDLRNLWERFKDRFK